MKKEILILLILLLLLYGFKSKKTEVNTGYLVSSFKQGNDVFFAVQINNEWQQINASQEQEQKIGNVTLKITKLDNLFKLQIFKNSSLEDTYFADENGILTF